VIYPFPKTFRIGLKTVENEVLGKDREKK